MDLSPLEQQAAFITDIHPNQHFTKLFDHFKDICLFAKNREGRILVANTRLVQLYGFEREEEMIGKTDFDLLPHRLAEKYRKDDQDVMADGTPMVNMVELFLNRQGIPGWYLTTKLPALDRKGNIIGVMGTIRPYVGRMENSDEDTHMESAMDHIRNHYTESLSIKTLADLAELSLRQFERRFKSYFNSTPQQFIMRMRIHAACEVLREQTTSIGHIALTTGFYDQSSFTRQFKKIMGMTPLQYRKQYH